MWKKLLRFAAAVTLTWSAAAHAMLNIEITQGVEGATPIAIVPFGWSGQGKPPQDLAAIISSDMTRSGRFAPLPTAQLPAQPHDGSAINFAQWRGLSSDSLVVGQVQPQGGDNYLVKFQLFDVLQGKQLTGYSIPTTGKQMRRTAHQIADLIYQKLTGQRGAFDTHIAYVTVEQVGNNKQRFRLAVADADGYNEQTILTSSQPLMSPTWSPDGKRLAYVSFEEGHSAIYIQDVATGTRKKVADYPGLNSAPAFSPDSSKLAMALSKDGNAEIYLLDMDSGKLQRITRDFAIDTEPAWAPDGKSLVFTSDRGGSPQLYRVALGPGGAVGSPQRLTFDGNYNAGAAFSPDGRYLAMVHGDNGAFRIAVQDLSNGNLQVLTNTTLDESPSFAPNGSMIMYATEVNNRGVLAVVSVDGRAHQKLMLKQGDVREPAWSPFISQ